MGREEKKRVEGQRDWVSTAGRFLQFIQAIANAVYDRGGSDEDLWKIVRNRKKLDKIAQEILSEPTSSPYKVYPISFWEHFRLSELSNSVSPSMDPDLWDKLKITTDLKKYGHRDLILLHIGRTRTTAEILEELTRHGLRPAVIEEILAFTLGYSKPNFFYNKIIVALGSLAQDDKSRAIVPALHNDIYGQSLRASLLYDEWNDCHYFLAVSKEVPLLNAA